MNVLTVHAEVEGIICEKIFDEFLGDAKARGIYFVPLGELPEYYKQSKPDKIVARDIPGREGWISCQSNSSCL